MTERDRGIAVADAHRRIRVLADGEGPFPGELVSIGDGLAVRMPAEELRQWRGWAFTGAEHVATPVDLALGEGATDVLLPWCVRRIAVHLAERGEIEPGGVTRGAAVTLAVSMLRGVVELATERADGPSRRDPTNPAPEEPRGEWWLTDEGRPVFAIETSPGTGETSSGAAQRLLHELEGRVDDRALRRLLGQLASALDDPRRARAEAARWEQELLEIAAPRPLNPPGGEGAISVDTTSGPTPGRQRQQLRRRDLRVVGEPRARRRRAFARRPERGVHRTPGILASAVKAASAVRVAIAGGVRRIGAPSPSHSEGSASAVSAGRSRRWTGPAIVAGSVAVAIAAAGVLWPSGGGSADAADRAMRPQPTATARTPTDAPHPDRAHTDSPSPTAPDPGIPGPSEQPDAERAGQELIAAAIRCGADPVPSCGELWDGGASAAKPVRDQDGRTTMIEDYGDIAAVRSGDGTGAQMVVIIRRDAEWRIRDVYDIANPPSEGAAAP